MVLFATVTTTTTRQYGRGMTGSIIYERSRWKQQQQQQRKEKNKNQELR